MPPNAIPTPAEIARQYPLGRSLLLFVVCSCVFLGVSLVVVVVHMLVGRSMHYVGLYLSVPTILITLIAPYLPVRSREGFDDFTLENGAAQLAPFFQTVARDDYEDGLLVTNAEPLLASIDSMLSRELLPVYESEQARYRRPSETHF